MLLCGKTPLIKPTKMYTDDTQDQNLKFHRGQLKNGPSEPKKETLNTIKILKDIFTTRITHAIIGQDKKHYIHIKYSHFQKKKNKLPLTNRACLDKQFP